MSNIESLKGRLLELSNRLSMKDNLGKEYKKIVGDSLARIKAKITKLLKDQEERIQKLKSESTSNLQQTKAELEAEQARLVSLRDAALEGAKRTQSELENNLAATNQQLNDLQAEINRPNPNTQNMQVIVDKLQNDLKNAQTASLAANAKIEELTARLVAYDGMRDKMNQLVNDLLAKIGDILAQVDAMSINQGDITELLQLLSDTENLFPKDTGDNSSPGDAGGNTGILGNLFGALTNANIPPVAAAGAGDVGSSGLPPPRQPRAPNTALGQYDSGILKPMQNNKLGGKTRRRGYKKTYRGGYVNKPKSMSKKRRRRTQTSKRRSSKRSSASSSSL
jgi:predicted  nucleic acid-binding Zn-ribbon protein